MAKLTDVVGVGPAIAKLLSDHHIKTVKALASISMSELLKVPGFSDLRAHATIKAANNCLQGGTAQQSTAVSKPQTSVKKVVSKKAITNPVIVKFEAGIGSGKKKGDKKKGAGKKKDKEKAKVKGKDKKKKGKDKGKSRNKKNK
tara:strand:- start:1895 stop:2326 length:432 start_codon:yes stop_codon:yes gene_type:complete